MTFIDLVISMTLIILVPFVFIFLISWLADFFSDESEIVKNNNTKKVKDKKVWEEELK